MGLHILPHIPNQTRTFIFVSHPLVMLTRLGISTHISLEHSSTWYLYIPELKPWSSFALRTRTPECTSHDNAGCGVTAQLNLWAHKVGSHGLGSGWLGLFKPHNTTLDRWAVLANKADSWRMFYNNSLDPSVLCSQAPGSGLDPSHFDSWSAPIPGFKGPF